MRLSSNVKVMRKEKPVLCWKNRSFFVKTIRITPGAMGALKAAGTFGTEYVQRHQAGDWGEADEEDKEINERGLAGEEMSLMSVFTLPRTGETLWLITASDRSYTLMLLPEEY